MSKRYFARLSHTFALVRFEIRAYGLSLVGLVKSKVFFDKNKVNKLEIGAGNVRKNGFITLDLSRKTDFPFDLRIGLPFPDESLDFIYSEHVMEHFSYDDLRALLKDCYRALKPSGIFSAAIPNARIYLDAYLHPANFDREKYCQYKQYHLAYKSRIDFVNYIFYMNGHHRYMFDEDNIQSVLTDVGLRNVRLRDFDPTLDQEARRYESIYAEAVK